VLERRFQTALGCQQVAQQVVRIRVVGIQRNRLTAF
jgi:hypothetical protein